MKERFHTTFFKLNVTNKLGALFIINYITHFNKNKEFQITLTIPGFARGIYKTNYYFKRDYFFRKIIGYFFYFKVPSPGSETYLIKKYLFCCTMFFI